MSRPNMGWCERCKGSAPELNGLSDRVCGKCRAASAKTTREAGYAWRRAHAEERNAAMRDRYRAKHAELRAAMDLYARAHRQEKREYDRQYREEHKQKHLDDTRRWRNENKEHFRAKQKTWPSQSPARIAEARQRLRLRDPEKFRLNNRKKRLAYKAAYPDRFREGKRKYYVGNYDKYVAYAENRRALLLEAPGSFTAADIKHLFRLQGGRCANPKCGRELSLKQRCPIAQRGERDHIHPLKARRGQPKGSNWIENIWLLCAPCNHSKFNKALADLAKPGEWGGLPGMTSQSPCPGCNFWIPEPRWIATSSTITCPHCGLETKKEGS